jgi:hypothetical protein
MMRRYSVTEQWGERVLYPGIVAKSRQDAIRQWLARWRDVDREDWTVTGARLDRQYTNGSESEWLVLTTDGEVRRVQVQSWGTVR